MPTTMTRTRTRFAVVIAALALVLPAGCAGGDGGTPATAEAAAPIARDLASYDVYVMANAENNPLFADVYGIRLNPFAIDRITVNKRVSSLGADEKHVLVAAADENIDQLAQVSETGDLQPIPGLGRPFAYGPEIVDGVLYYSDAQGDDTKGENRYYAWNLANRTKRLLLQTDTVYGGSTPISGGRLLLGVVDEGGERSLVIRGKSGRVTKYTASGGSSNGRLGRNLQAVTLVGEGNEFGNKPEAMVLVDIDTGRKKRIDGLKFVAWSPDRTRILARRTDNLAESRLVVLDPQKLEEPPLELATVPGLAIFGGVWVRGASPS